MNKYTIFFLFLITPLFSIFAQYQAVQPKGKGSQADPYIISTAENLRWIAVTINKGGKLDNCYFIQTKDIDLSLTKNETNGLGWEPIGGYFYLNGLRTKLGFSGIYDGKGHKISQLFINRPLHDYQALFGYVSKAKIMNLTIEQASVDGNEYTAAAFAYTFESEILNCHVVNSTINGTAFYTGALIGNQSAGICKQCSTNATTSGNDYLGGIVGWLETGTVSDCFAQGQIESIVRNGKPSRHTGGIVGYCNSSSIYRCLSDFELIQGADYTGAICGSAEKSKIKECVNTAKKMIGRAYVGGLVGRLNESELSNSYTISNIMGEEFVGGIAGFATYSSMKIDKVYSVSVLQASSDDNSKIGEALGGYGTGVVTNVFYDNSINKGLFPVGAPHQNNLGIQGIGKEALRKSSTFSGWDFSSIWNIDAKQNMGFPMLRWQLKNNPNAIISVSTPSVMNNIFSVFASKNKIYIRPKSKNIVLRRAFSLEGVPLKIRLEADSFIIEKPARLSPVFILQVQQDEKIITLKANVL